MGIQLDRVEIALGGAGVFTPADLDDYLAAAPDPILTESVEVRLHLNAEHADELRILASRLLAVDPDGLAAATLEWIDAEGMDLAVIDDLGVQLHRLLS